MKILVFNGSPKKEKSDTLHIANAFIEGCQDQNNNDVELINVNDLNLEYCKGCFSCKYNGGHCVIDDDMKDIIQKILDNDILIFSFPLHSYGMSAALKNLIDRTMPMSAMTMQKVKDRYEHVSQTNYEHLKYVMICGCGFPNSKHNFEAVVEQFKLMFPNNHTIITISESPMFGTKEAESVTLPRLQKIKEAGKEYIKKYTISGELMTEITSPMIPEEIYAKICNGER